LTVPEYSHGASGLFSPTPGTLGSSAHCHFSTYEVGITGFFG
jgi:hypothetical protein